MFPHTAAERGICTQSLHASITGSGAESFTSIDDAMLVLLQSTWRKRRVSTISNMDLDKG
jgi:hypothetical protein